MVTQFRRFISCACNYKDICPLSYNRIHGDLSPLPITLSLLIVTLFIGTSSNVSSKQCRIEFNSGKILEEPGNGFRFRHCSRSLLAQQREQLLASVAGSSGLSVLNFIVKFHSGNCWIERLRSGQNGQRQRNWILTLAVMLRASYSLS